MKKLVLLLLILAGGLRAEEVILDFQSRIEVQKNGDLDVTETITVRAEGKEIKRGIYRDFPTLYQGAWGLKSVVPFEVLEVRRGGEPEPWHTKSLGNGMRVYFGQAEVELNPGDYIYTLRYRTGRQLGFFQDHDELSWNVTGNGWAFPIDQASAEVVLPADLTIQSAEAYTGGPGAKGQDYEVTKLGNQAVFQTTTRLGVEEGLTVVVTWAKGFIEAPSQDQALMALVRANLGVVLGVCGLVIVFLYYLAVWMLYGRDPERGVIIPRYEAPEGMSPAVVRFVRGLGKFDDTTLAASILHLAVLGAIKIEGGGQNDYGIEKKSQPTLPPEANTLFQELLGTRQQLVFKNTNHEIFKKAKAALLKAVRKQCEVVYFRRNVHLWVVGLLLTLVPMGVSLFSAKQIEAAVFAFFWLSIWSCGVAALSVTVFAQWRQPGWKRLGALPMTLFALPFFAGWFFGMGMLVFATSGWVCAIYLAGILMTVFFHHLLKQPTAEGRIKLDEIEGFRRYLSVAEEDRLNLENPPERTPELFEKFLPYALALGVEQKWSEHFAGVLTEAQYQPEWYSGNQGRNFMVAGFATGLGASLAGSIAASSSAPGSSSGSGGGGSSGGGGGGGGGGGW